MTRLEEKTGWYTLGVPGFGEFLLDSDRERRQLLARFTDALASQIAVE